MTKTSKATKRARTRQRGAKSEGRKPARTAPQRRPPARTPPALEQRLDVVEARVTALTHAVLFAAVRALVDSDDPAGEIRLHQQQTLQAAQALGRNADAAWLAELMRFFDAVARYFSRDH